MFQAQYDAAELIMQREVVSQQINEELMNRATQFGLMLDDISIVCILLLKCVLLDDYPLIIIVYVCRSGFNNFDVAYKFESGIRHEMTKHSINAWHILL